MKIITAKTYTYKFITQANEVVEYDEAVAINYYKKPGPEQFFMQISLK